MKITIRVKTGSKQYDIAQICIPFTAVIEDPVVKGFGDLPMTMEEEMEMPDDGSDHWAQGSQADGNDDAPQGRRSQKQLVSHRQRSPILTSRGRDDSFWRGHVTS